MPSTHSLKGSYQRDAHQEDRSPEGAGPGGAGGPRKEVSSSSGDQSSSGAWVGDGPEHLGIGPWGAVAEPVELAQPPWSQAVVVMAGLEQVGRNPVDAAATAAVAAASKAAPGEGQQRGRERHQSPCLTPNRKGNKPINKVNTQT